jgi:hypothetical protein
VKERLNLKGLGQSWEDNIKVDLKWGWSCVEWNDLPLDREKAVLIANEPSGGSTNCWEFLDNL